MQPINYQGHDFNKQNKEFVRQHGDLGTPEGYARRAEIERLQRASIGNGDPDERARISREIAALEAQL